MPIDLNKSKLNRNFYEPFPSGLTVKAWFTLQKGSYGEDGWLHQRPHGYLYLAGSFTIMNGRYVDRKIYQEIGVEAYTQQSCDPLMVERWEEQGRSLLCALIESAKGIHPDDMSESAQAARRLKSYAELNGLECGIIVGKDGYLNNLPSTNTVQQVITPAHRDYVGVIHHNEEIYNYPIHGNSEVFILKEGEQNLCKPFVKHQGY